MVGGRLIFAQLCQAQHRSALKTLGLSLAGRLHGGQKFYGSTGAPDLLKAASSSVSRRGQKIARFPAFKRLLIDWGAVSWLRVNLEDAIKAGFWPELVEAIDF